MRVRTVVTLAAVALLGAGSGEKANAAQCPDECRRETAEVICSTVKVETNDGVTTFARYYWSNGAD